jgi:hypothetical protein
VKKFKVGDLIYLEEPYYTVAVVLGEGNWKGWMKVHILSESLRFNNRCQVSDDMWEKL